MLGTAFHMLSDNTPLLKVPGRICIIGAPSQFVSNTKIFISDDSVTWTTYNAPSSISSNFGKLMAYNKVFYFFPNDGTTNVCTSVDGISWTVTTGSPLTNIYGANNGYVWGNTATLVKQVYKIVSGVWTLIGPWTFDVNYVVGTDGSASSPYMIAINKLSPYDVNRSFGATSWSQLNTFKDIIGYGLSRTATDNWRTLMSTTGPYLMSISVDAGTGTNVWTAYGYRNNIVTSTIIPGYKPSGAVAVGPVIIGYDRAIMQFGDFISSNGTSWTTTGNSTAVSPFMYANSVFLSGKHVSTDGINWDVVPGWESTLAPYVRGYDMIARG